MHNRGEHSLCDCLKSVPEFPRQTLNIKWKRREEEGSKEVEKPNLISHLCASASLQPANMFHVSVQVLQGKYV